MLCGGEIFNLRYRIVFVNNRNDVLICDKLTNFSLVQQAGIFSHVFLIRKTQSLDQSMEYMIKGMKTGREGDDGRKNASASGSLGAPASV